MFGKFWDNLNYFTFTWRLCIWAVWSDNDKVNFCNVWHPIVFALRPGLLTKTFTLKVSSEQLTHQDGSWGLLLSATFSPGFTRSHRSRKENVVCFFKKVVHNGVTLFAASEKSQTMVFYLTWYNIDSDSLKFSPQSYISIKTWFLTIQLRCPVEGFVLKCSVVSYTRPDYKIFVT